MTDIVEIYFSSLSTNEHFVYPVIVVALFVQFIIWELIKLCWDSWFRLSYIVELDPVIIFTTITMNWAMELGSLRFDVETFDGKQVQSMNFVHPIVTHLTACDELSAEDECWRTQYLISIKCKVN